MNTLEVLNISISYKSKNIMDDFSFAIHKGENITIIGKNGTAKTSLINVLKNNIIYNGTYRINGVEIVASNAYLINRYIMFIDNEKDKDSRKVVDFLFDALNEKKFDTEKEEKLVNNIVKFFAIDDLLDFKLNSLNYDDYYLIKILSQLLLKKTYLVLDDVLCHLNNKRIDLLYAYCHKNNISIINFTTQIEETLKSDYLICLYNGKIAMEGPTLSCLQEEKLLKRIGFNLPFMVDLSIQLNYYGVIEKMFLDKKEMVQKIWN